LQDEADKQQSHRGDNDERVASWSYCFLDHMNISRTACRTLPFTDLV
jgi:hypothetical protein